MYLEKDLVGIAKRENNLKRKYLVVNRLQGKHVPVVPSAALNMFRELGELIAAEYGTERLLLIGFAETATAVGAAAAIRTGACYLQTTREKLEHVSYLYFSEDHSHATEQKLVREDVEEALAVTERVVFVEDEITTGNTILNIIRLMEREYPGRLKFSAASLLNGMDGEHRRVFEDLGVRLHYLVKTCHGRYEEAVESVAEDGSFLKPPYAKTLCLCGEQEAGGYLNARRLVTGERYEAACAGLWRQLEREISLEGKEKILVLGTEEFMFPALYAAEQIEALGKRVFFHATTRSPILVSRNAGYPLHTRYELASVYDRERTTYLYDLDRYDKVLVITDAPGRDTPGTRSLVNALCMAGNTDITWVRWRDAKEAAG